VTAFDGPPRACPLCLFGLCQKCTGRMQVHDHRNVARDVPCEHEHPARGPITRTLADIRASREG